MLDNIIYRADILGFIGAFINPRANVADGRSIRQDEYDIVERSVFEGPDQFHKVPTGIGTFVDLKGGYVHPEKVLSSEKKPIRIFMIDGRNDNRGTTAQGGTYDPHRDWFLQNVRLWKL